MVLRLYRNQEVLAFAHSLLCPKSTKVPVTAKRPERESFLDLRLTGAVLCQQPLQTPEAGLLLSLHSRACPRWSTGLLLQLPHRSHLPCNKPCQAEQPVSCCFATAACQG